MVLMARKNLYGLDPCMLVNQCVQRMYLPIDYRSLLSGSHQSKSSTRFPRRVSPAYDYQRNSQENAGPPTASTTDRIVPGLIRNLRPENDHAEQNDEETAPQRE
jgi:hypothetical protein